MRLRVKREKFIWPLTQSHHRALLAARRVRESLSTVPPSEEAEWAKKIGLEVREFFEKEMRQHFLDEEKIISILEAHAGKNDENFERIRTDHQRLESLAQSEDREGLLRFGEILVKHVRFEEDVVFADFETELTVDEKLEIGKLLEQHSPQ